MNLSNFAMRVLQAHAQHPRHNAYALVVLGGYYRDSDLERLDEAYDELTKAGLMEKSKDTMSFFGTPKALYRITEAGAKEAATETAA